MVSWIIPIVRQSMKQWSYIWLEFGLFSTIITIIRACACWALFAVTLTNTVHLIYIYIWFYIGSDHRYLNRFEWITLYMCDLYYHRITTTNGCFVDGILSVDYSTNELFREQISWNFMCMTYSVICGYFSNSTHRNILWLDTFHIWHYQIGMGY